MKQWLTINFLSTGVTMDEPSVIGKKEFYFEMGLIAITLALFGILLHAF